MNLNRQTFDQVAQAAGVSQQAAATEAEVTKALKEALAQGVTNGIASLGRTNGFYGNAAVRIPLPEPIAKVSSKLRTLGLNRQVDEFELSLNRAAEQAVPEVADIFGDAIRKMSVADARAILDGPDDAATQYFRREAVSSLYTRIRPLVENSTAQVGVTNKYKAMMGNYGSLLQAAGVKNTDLDGYVTNKAIDGLFYMMASEEARIRRDPRARGTELLRKVFGSHP